MKKRRGRSIAVWVVLVLAGLLLLLSSFAVWVNRVALNTDVFVDTSTELIEDDAIREAVAAGHVNVDTILQNLVRESAELSFSVPTEDVPATRRALEGAQEAIGPFGVDEIGDLGKVSLVGAGMRSHPGVAASMFRTLADAGVNIRLISTSPIKISCMIARDDVERGVRALHTAFSLGQEAGRKASE